MGTKLTKKDKIMLYVLVVFLICFGIIWLVIIPQMDKSGELDLAISDLQAQKFPMEAAIKGLDGMNTNYETALENYDAALQDFYPHLENYEIDKMMTGLVSDDYNLTITSLNMSAEPAGVAVEQYHAAVVQEENSDTTGEASDESTDGESISVLTSNVSTSASGTRKNIEALVNTLFRDYPAIRVTSYSITDDSDSASLSLNCDVYMKATA